MRPLRVLPLSVLASALLIGTSMAQQFAATVRIVNPIDETQLVTLTGNTHPSANAKNDRGPVSPTLAMTDLIMVLSRSPQQQAAFDKFVAAQYDSNSPDFHHWLAPEEVGTNFGPSQTDIATISNWLTGHGFTVDEVTKDRMAIRFSGTAGQVESAFHTEIHNLEVKGEAHIGNMSDPQIPAALVPAVVGVKALHNFFAKPLHKLGSKATRNGETGKWERVAGPSASSTQTSTATKSLAIRPEFGVNTGSGSTANLIEDVTPYDFAAIYNVLPLWNASSPIDGTGQTIAIAATSSVNPSDISAFRNAFGLPTSNAANTPQLVSGNSSPVTVCTDTTGTLPFPTNPCGLGDLLENSLDAEWSGAVAKNAQIVVVSSYPTSASDDGLWDSENFIINNKTAKIMNVSYGLCELAMGTAGNAAYNTLWQSAYSEGIAVFVASGDEGAASCDAGEDSNFGTPWAAQFGTSVSGFASTPYNTAVGGTDFNWCNQNSSTACPAAPYWSATNSTTTGASALGYLPEVPWNDTCSNPLTLSLLENIASQVSYSGTVKDTETACNFVGTDALYVFEHYIYSDGSPVDISYFVDTVGGSGGASNCTASDGQTVASCTGGYAKPSWQTGVSGIPSDGKRDIPDVSFFASNGFLGSAYLICVSEAGSACTYSSTVENPAQEVGGTSVSSPAMAGVMALINQKAGTPQGNPNVELYKLASQQTYGNCSAERGNGSPVTSSSCLFNDIDTGTIAMPCDYSAPDGGILYDSLGNPFLVAQQPGTLSPNCRPNDAGDTVAILSGYGATGGYDLATGLGSLNVANVVNSFVAVGTGAVTVTVVPGSSSITANQTLNVVVTVASSPAGGTTPTGTVTLSGGGYTAPSGSLASGTFTFSIPGDSLSAGTDTLTVNYSGDTNYAATTGTGTVVVTKLAAVVTVTPTPIAINSNQTLTVSGTVAGSGGTPTGTVMVSGGGYTSSALTLSNGSYTVTIPVNTFKASGVVTLSAVYSGDSTYLSESGSGTVTVTVIVVLTPTVAVTASPNPVDSNATLSVKATVTGTGATPTGTVVLSGGGLSPTLTGTVSGGVYTFSVPASGLNIGTDTLTVTYSGDGNYSQGAPGTASVTVNQSAFTLAATAATISSPGGTGTSTVTVTNSNGYSGTVTLSCALTSSPLGAVDLPTCTVGAVSSGTATATVNTTAATSELVYPKLGGRGRGWLGAGGGAVLALLMFFGIPARRRSWQSMLGILMLMVALGSMAGCGGGGGGGGGGNSGTTAGAYTFTVTGTGSPAVSPAPSAAFTATVN